MDGPTTRLELRELQRPIKERFADDPEAARSPSLSVSLERD